jgi:hypothetical protein
MDLEKVAYSFGLPGLLIFIWYLLERQKNIRLEKSDEAKLKIEDKKVDALTIGFQSLSGKIDAHAVTDIKSHSELFEKVSRIEGLIDGRELERERTGMTPVGGVPIVRSQQRLLTKGVPTPTGGYSIQKPPRGRDE